MSNTFVFLHIPKSAGTSLIRVIENRQSPEQTFPIYRNRADRYQQLAQMDSGAHERLRFIYGHFPFGVHELVNNRCNYVTLLRNPVDRIISDYYHARRHKDSPVHQVATEGTIYDFLDYRLHTQNLNNRMTRFISGFHGLNEGAPNADLATYEPLPLEALDIAIHNLNTRFEFVGITEYFDESLLFLKDVCNWRNVYYYKRNIGTNRPEYTRTEFPKNLAVFIKESNSLDVKLYNYYLASFERKLQMVGNEFQQELHRFRACNKFVSKLLDWDIPQRLRQPLHKVVQLIP